MKVATTIQISSEEDREITHLKGQLKLPSKKAVVLEGLQILRRTLQEQGRRRRLQEASRRVRESSSRGNREWSGLSTAFR